MKVVSQQIYTQIDQDKILIHLSWCGQAGERKLKIGNNAHAQRTDSAGYVCMCARVGIAALKGQQAQLATLL